MNCPACHENSDKVIDSRESIRRSGIRRRRECLKCKKRWTTYEYSDKDFSLRREIVAIKTALGDALAIIRNIEAQQEEDL